MNRLLIIGAVIAASILGIGAIALAQGDRTATIEVRVWEHVNDPERNFISARPAGGSWRALGTIPIPLTDGQSGSYRYGDIELDVPLPETAAAAPRRRPRRSSRRIAA